MGNYCDVCRRDVGDGEGSTERTINLPIFGQVTYKELTAMTEKDLDNFTAADEEYLMADAGRNGVDIGTCKYCGHTITIPVYEFLGGFSERGK